MDKVLQYENIIQAFSRTNRLFGEDKPFGVIRYYRRPHTMEKYINDAVKLYSGDKPLGLFVDKLPYNLKKINEKYNEIFDIFKGAGYENFEKLPDERTECAKFASLFKELNTYLEAAKIQGLSWNKNIYKCEDEGELKKNIELKIDERTYLILASRYKELQGGGDDPNNIRGGDDDIPYDIDGYLIEIDTDKIDADFMNSRFTKYLKVLKQNNAVEEIVQEALDELHKSFASLTQEEQKYANIFLNDVQSGDIEVEEEMTLREYITEYQCRAKDDQIHRFAVNFALDEEKLRNIMSLKITEKNINEFGRYDDLMSTVDKKKAKEYFERIEGIRLIPPKVNIKMDSLLRKFILSGGFEIENI